MFNFSCILFFTLKNSVIRTVIKTIFNHFFQLVRKLIACSFIAIKHLTCDSLFKAAMAAWCAEGADRPRSFQARAWSLSEEKLSVDQKRTKHRVLSFFPRVILVVGVVSWTTGIEIGNVSFIGRRQEE